MEVIIWNLKDTGARWVVFGDKAYVDANSLEDFMKEHPEAKMEVVNIENRAAFN